MAKKGRQKSTAASGSGHQCTSLREENFGRKHINPLSVLKLQHLQKLATWAGGEASIPPLAAHFGRMLAANAEHEGIPLDRSVVSCQRCETVLQPGYNCSIRIEKNVNGAKRRRRSCLSSQNNVVYTCHFCSHRNVRKGTPSGHLQELFASRVKPIPHLKPVDSSTPSIFESEEIETDANKIHGLGDNVGEETSVDIESSPKKEVACTIPAGDGLKTPSAIITEKKRKVTEGACGATRGANSAMNSAANGSGKESASSSKRRRKGLSSLREIAMSGEREKEKRVDNFAIPFRM